jgi:hypothetical protein
MRTEGQKLSVFFISAYLVLLQQQILTEKTWLSISVQARITALNKTNSRLFKLV